jgi:hypothetical protein
MRTKVQHLERGFVNEEAGDRAEMFISTSAFTACHRASRALHKAEKEALTMKALPL